MLITLSKHSKPFYCIISLSSHKTCFTHIFVQRQALRVLHFFSQHTQQNNHADKPLYDASTTTTTTAASPIAARNPCHCHDRRYGAGHCFKTSKLYSYLHHKRSEFNSIIYVDTASSLHRHNPLLPLLLIIQRNCGRHHHHQRRHRKEPPLQHHHYYCRRQHHLSKPSDIIIFQRPIFIRP